MKCKLKSLLKEYLEVMEKLDRLFKEERELADKKVKLEKRLKRALRKVKE